MKKLILTALMCILPLIGYQIKAEQAQAEQAIQDNTELNKPELTVQEINKYSSDLIRYNERLLEIFQTVGHFINKGNSKLAGLEKKAAYKWVQNNQKNINTINQNLGDNLSENILNHYVIKSSNIIIALNMAIASDFKTLAQTDINIKRSRLDEAEKVSVDVEDILQNVDQKLSKTSKKVEQLGFAKINLAIRKLEEIDFKYGITPKIKKTAIISAVLGVSFLLIPKSWVPENFTVIKNSKNWLDEKTTFPKNNNAEEENNNTLKVFLSGVIGAVLIDAYKKDLGDIIKSLETSFRTGVLSSIKDTYAWMRGTPSKVSEDGYEFVNSHHTLDDPKLVGLESQREALDQVVTAVKNLKIFEKSKIEIPKAILIAGPAGCGKSHLARAVCGSINKYLDEEGGTTKIAFKELRFSSLWWKEDGIMNIIKDARKHAPCILFIDEIHLLRLQTEGDNKTLMEFLTVLSGLSSGQDPQRPVIIIAATNRPDLLDPALLRSGRFEVIKVEKPDFNTRFKYFNVMLKEQGINTENLDLDKIAKLTENCSYAQLEEVIRSSRFTAKSQARGISSTQDLENSVDSVVFKIKKEETLPISEESKKIIAAQVAGKSLLYVLWDNSLNNKILKATLKGYIPAIKESVAWGPKDKTKGIKDKSVKYGNIFTYTKDEIAKLEDTKNLELQAKILLSGKLSENILLATSHDVRKNDKNKALEITKKIAYNGLKSENLNKNLAKEYDQKAINLLEKFEQEVNKVLTDNKQKLESIYKLLLEKTSLSREELLA